MVVSELGFGEDVICLSTWMIRASKTAELVACICQKWEMLRCVLMGNLLKQVH